MHVHTCHFSNEYGLKITLRIFKNMNTMHRMSEGKQLFITFTKRKSGYIDTSRYDLLMPRMSTYSL